MLNLVRKHLKTFRSDERGNFLMMSAFAVPVVIFAIGSAVDLANFKLASSTAQAAVDTASLAASRAITVNDASLTEATQIARSQLSMNIDSISYIDAAATTDSLRLEQNLNDGTLTASVDVQTPTLFAAVFGYNNISTTLSSTNQVQSLEIAFVLDNTGSMSRSINGSVFNNERINALRGAMNNAIDLLLPDGRVNDNRVRASIIPYVDGVNMGAFYQAAVGEDAPASQNTCVTERETSDMFEDVAPVEGVPSSFYETDVTLLDISPQGTGEGNTIPCPAVPILPLTSARDTLVDAVNGMVPDGYTAGHNGISWGFNTLSAEWRDFWPAESRPAEYATPNVRKILVVMTDGEFNTSYEDQVTQGNRDNARGSNTARFASEQAARSFCDMAKDVTRGVVVYTVTLGSNENAQNLMAECATNQSTALIAESAEELTDAFERIVIEARTAILTN